jgi:hypothetical protein
MSSASSAVSSAAASLTASGPSSSSTIVNEVASATGASTTTIIITTILITTTTIAAVLAGIYYSGYADDILEAMAKKYYSAKAQAEAVALANTGSEKVQGVLKGEPTPQSKCYDADRNGQTP